MMPPQAQLCPLISNRARAARYGLNVADLQLVIATAVGGMDVTQTIEGLELSLQGLSEHRAQVWPGGLAILAELFVALKESGLGAVESFGDMALSPWQPKDSPALVLIARRLDQV